MAYDVSDVELYEYSEGQTWASGLSITGTAAINKYIIGPRGKAGFVRDMMVEVTTSMVGTTTVPELQIGISSGDFTYGRYRLGTATATGYNTGTYRASAELITGNPPRAATDFASHVVLDGGPLSSKGIAGGSYGTVVPQGRIPASGWVITSVVQGVDSSHSRIYAQGVNPGAPFKDLSTGMLVNVQGVVGSTSVNANKQAITALDTTSFLYFEVAQTFSTAYTSGGVVSLNTVVTLLANGAGSGAGGGAPRIKIEWVGPNVV
jgi:hypothetical protein